MADELEDPVGVGGPPVVAVAVEDDGRVVGDAERATVSSANSLGVDVVARELVLEVGVPVDLRPRRGCGRCRRAGFLVRLDDADPGRSGAARPIRCQTSTAGWRNPPYLDDLSNVEISL